MRCFKTFQLTCSVKGDADATNHDLGCVWMAPALPSRRSTEQALQTLRKEREGHVAGARGQGLSRGVVASRRSELGWKQRAMAVSYG